MLAVPGERRIVVGVDGSLPSLFALHWAGREASLRRAELCAVIVDADTAAPLAPYAPAQPVAGRIERRAALGQTLVESITSALGPVPDVAVHEHVEEGRPADVLVRYSEGAELLVLGSRVWNDADARPLGPVVRACIRTATCPVVVASCEGDLSWSQRGQTTRRFGAGQRGS